MKKISIALFVLSFIIAALFLLSPVTVLEIRSMDKNAAVFRRKVAPGYAFATLIRHSVHLTPVYEYYSVNNEGGILLRGTRLQDLGWGVPSTFSEDVRIEDSFIVIDGMDRPIDLIPFRVSHIAYPRLLLDDCAREIDLTLTVDDFDRLDIFTERIALWNFLLRGEVDVFSEKAARQ